MYLMYADESGNTGTDLDNKQQPIFVLAGVLIKDTNWHKINNYFNVKKQEILPILEKHEIHTNELFNSSKKSVFNQFNWKDNFTTLEKLIDLILELDISAYYIAVDKKGFKKEMSTLFSKSIKLDPYITSFTLLYSKISQLLHKKHTKGMIFLDTIIDIPKQLYDIYPELSKNNNTMIEKAMFLDSKDTNFIQIADVFAFYIEKYISITFGYKEYGIDKKEHCINMYNKLSKKINSEYSEFMDYKKMCKGRLE